MQQLLPHFLLRAAKIDDIAGKTVRPAEHPSAKIEELVERRRDVFAIAEIVAEIDKAIAAEKPLADQIVDTCQPPRLAMDGTHRPNPSGIAQLSKSVA